MFKTIILSLYFCAFLPIFLASNTSIAGVDYSQFKTGDIIFHDSDTTQANVLKSFGEVGTHMGIIVDLGAGNLVVYESGGTKPGKHRTLKEFINAGKGQKFSVARVKTPENYNMARVIDKAKEETLKSYGTEFNSSDQSKSSCSLCVWRSFEAGAKDQESIAQKKLISTYLRDVFDDMPVNERDRYIKLAGEGRVDELPYKLRVLYQRWPEDVKYLVRHYKGQKGARGSGILAVSPDTIAESDKIYFLKHGGAQLYSLTPERYVNEVPQGVKKQPKPSHNRKRAFGAFPKSWGEFFSP
jgi:hypothetical protein